MMRIIGILCVCVTFFSCNEDLYKNAFENKIKQDLEFNKQMLEYEFSVIKETSLEVPHKLKSTFEDILKIKSTLSEFKEKALNSSELNSVNKHRVSLLSNVKEYRLKHNKINSLTKLESILENKITTNIEKLLCVNHGYKSFLLEVKHLNNYRVWGTYCGGYDVPRINTFRLNDSIVVLNFAGDEYIDSDEYNDDYLKLNVYPKNSNKAIPLVKDYFVFSEFIPLKSDSLTVKIKINTNEKIRVRLIDEEKTLKVGESIKLNFDIHN